MGKLLDLNPYTFTTMTVIQDQVKSCIISYLEACNPATFTELITEVGNQCMVRRQILLPTVITALASLMEEGKITEYEQYPLLDPFDYAWDLPDHHVH